MLTGLNKTFSKNYDMEKELFNCFIENNIISGEGYQILVGDFNNAMHYSDINKSFCEVENQYWRNDWDEIRKCYVGEKYKRAQYSYNLHVIKDALKQKGLILREDEDDYSFIDKYGNYIHDDHFFVDSRIEDRCTVEFNNFKLARP